MSENSDVAAEIGTDPAVDASGDASDNESYHGYSVDDETQPQSTGDSLTDDRGLPEPLDEGYSPPEKYSAGQGYGNTPLEESLGESFDQRLRQEDPEPDPYEQAALDDVVDEQGEDEEVGDQRAGRLVAPDEGTHLDAEKDAVAQDVGIDGAAASAEEAAMHVMSDEDL
jgi:hypothetical protein